MLLSQAFATTASKSPQQAAFHDLGKDLSFAEAKIRVSRLSYLYSRDIGTGARVAFYCSNHPLVGITFLALTNTRSVSIPMDPSWTPAEVEACLRATGATHVAVTSDRVTAMRDLLQSARLNLPLIEIEKKQGGEFDTSFTAAPDAAPAETDPVLLLRTGQYSGQARYASFTHKQLHAAASALKGKYRLQSADRIFTPLNWSHPFAFVHGLLLPLLSGVTSVVSNGFEGVELLDLLQSSRTTRIVATPQFLLKLLVACKNAKRVLPGVKSVTVGLGPIAPEALKAYTLLKIHVLPCYGQTETLWSATMRTMPGPDSREVAAPASVLDLGHGLPGFKYKLLDERGDEIPSHEDKTGMLAITGPALMSGYHGAEKETKQAIRGTWLYTGDVVTIEPPSSGEEDFGPRFKFVGRKEEVLPFEGSYASMARATAILRAIPGVQDAAAFLVRDSKGDPKVCAAVVKTPGNALTEKQVIAIAGERLETALVPFAVAFTDFIPRDSGGNIHQGRLRAQFSSLVS